MALLDRIGNEIGALGDRLGNDFLRYNPITFRRYDLMGIRDAPSMIETLRVKFPDASRVIDVGAGSGAFAAEARRQGLQVTAVERSRHGRRYAAKRHNVEALPFDLREDPPARVTGPFELAYCFEVAEHVPEALANCLVAFLCHLAPKVAFTAAAPGQGGTGHINEQPARYWTSKFVSRGWTLINFEIPWVGLSPHWARTNVFAFEQQDQTKR